MGEGRGCVGSRGWERGLGSGVGVRPRWRKGRKGL